MSEGKRRGVGVIVILIVLAVGAISMYFLEKDQTSNLTAEKVELKAEIESMTAKYDVLLSDKSTLNNELVTERNRLVALKDSILLLTDDNKAMKRYKDEVYALRKQRKKWLAKADRLQFVSDSLAMVNKQIVKELGNEKVRTKYLNEVNEDLNKTIESQKTLQVAGLVVKTYKTNLFGTEKESNKGAKVERMEVCFGIAENTLGEAGEKEMMVKVFDKKGKEISNRSKVVVYDNTALDLCLNMSTEDRFETGIYEVKVTMNDVVKATKSVVFE